MEKTKILELIKKHGIKAIDLLVSAIPGLA